jgi:uncharacterized protein GlcG (DUF336 family)
MIRPALNRRAIQGHITLKLSLEMPVKAVLILSVAVAALAAPALAQTPPAAKAPSWPAPPPRARGPALGPSIQAAQAAVAACAAQGYKVSAEIVDSAGEPVVLLSGDGASLRTQSFVRTKVAVVIRYKMTSGDVVAKMTADPAFAATIKADTTLDSVYQGGVPLMADGQMIGAFAASGAPMGSLDEGCVKTALASVSLK